MDDVKDDLESGLDYFEFSKEFIISTGVKCDLCNCNIGKVTKPEEIINIAHVISPEKFTEAIEKGLRPQKWFDDMAYEMWKYASISSETPWALYDKCNDKFEKIIQKEKRKDKDS